MVDVSKHNMLHFLTDPQHSRSFKLFIPFTVIEGSQTTAPTSDGGEYITEKFSAI
jgi:hypothetical protein